MTTVTSRYRRESQPNRPRIVSPTHRSKTLLCSPAWLRSHSMRRRPSSAFHAWGRGVICPLPHRTITRYTHSDGTLPVRSHVFSRLPAAMVRRAQRSSACPSRSTPWWRSKAERVVRRLLSNLPCAECLQCCLQPSPLSPVMVNLPQPAPVAPNPGRPLAQSRFSNFPPASGFPQGAVYSRLVRRESAPSRKAPDAYGELSRSRQGC